MTPAPYPANNTEELQAVITFLGLLDLKCIKPSPNWFDKIPNTDGHLSYVVKVCNKLLLIQSGSRLKIPAAT
jgi:hypothetical protein